MNPLTPKAGVPMGVWIAATLDDPSHSAVESEIRDLFDALGH